MINIDELLNAKEGENLEFKEARVSFSFETLMKNACALANRCGGKIVLGVTDKRPRQVVGTNAFRQPEETRRKLIEKLKINIDFEILKVPKRILIFTVAQRPVGLPVQAEGVAYWKIGDSIVAMPSEIHRQIYEESGHDFSADICPGAATDDLDMSAVKRFRDKWFTKTQNTRLKNLDLVQVLRDCEAITKDGVTYAALILFGKNESLGRFLAQSETVFEYHATEASGPAQSREEFRVGFFAYYDRIWELIDLRNNKRQYQDGLFVFDITTFNERVVREAVLNAVCHRDYRMYGSVFIRQFPDHMLIESPGGFPPGVTLENILDRQSPRNRRVAEILSRCGLVERSGQGMNLIYELCIREAKELPDFTGTDNYLVRINLNGIVIDPRMLALINRMGNELTNLVTDDFMVIHYLFKNEKVPDNLHARYNHLLNLGIIEKIGRAKYILSRKYYTVAGRAGVHTRLKGLDHEQNKTLVLNHLKNNRLKGIPISEFQQVLPMLPRNGIKLILNELRVEGKIYIKGIKRWARWFYKEKP